MTFVVICGFVRENPDVARVCDHYSLHVELVKLSEANKLALGEGEELAVTGVEKTLADND